MAKKCKDEKNETSEQIMNSFSKYLLDAYGMIFTYRVL